MGDPLIMLIEKYVSTSDAMSNYQTIMSTCQIIMLTSQMLYAMSIVRNVWRYLGKNTILRYKFSILILNSRNGVLI